MSQSGAERDAAWRELFSAHYPRLAGWARKLVGDDDTAHEIASEAFTRLMSRWSQVDSPVAYLYKIANNLVQDQWRRGQREQRTIRALAAGQRGQAGDRADGASDLRALIEDLPAHQRSAVLLHYLAGLSVHDVSLVVGRPAGTVKSDLYQARQRLRAKLDTVDD